MLRNIACTVLYTIVLTWTARAQSPEQQSELGTFTTFNFPGAGYTQARYINPADEVVGFYFDGTAFASPEHGFLRNKDGDLTVIDFPGTNGSTMAAGINSEGDAVGFYSAEGATHGFLRTSDGAFTSLDFPRADGTGAWGINARNDIVGQYGAGGTSHGFLRSKDGEFTSLDVPSSTCTQALAINSEGDIVGQYGAGGTTHGFVRNKHGGFTSFDVPGPINAGVGTQTRGINDRGDIVGWFVTSGGKRRGFL